MRVATHLSALRDRVASIIARPCLLVKGGITSRNQKKSQKLSMKLRICERLQPADVFKATAHIRTRCRAYLDCGGGHFKHFEHLLKSKKKNYRED